MTFAAIELRRRLSDDPHLATYLNILEEERRTHGSLGSYLRGEVEIISRPHEIIEVQQEYYLKLVKSGEHSSRALQLSRVGVLVDGLYGMWVRDAVIFPDGSRGLYDRFVGKHPPGVPSGVAILPKLPDGRILTLCIFRHATRSWELELPRGNREPSEDLEIAARRELREELGVEALTIRQLGQTHPDSGMSNLLAILFEAEISEEESWTPQLSEGITGVYPWTREELYKALDKGHICIPQHPKKDPIHVRDPFMRQLLQLSEVSK